jgi:AraC-like DNA-binding protein
MFKYENAGLDYAHKLDYASSPADEYNKHMHYFYEILYFIDGDVDYTIENVTKHLHPGDLVFIQPGKYHFATVNRNVLYERYVIKFPDTLVPEELKGRLSKLTAFFSDARAEEYIFKQFDAVYSRFSAEDTGLIFKAKTTELLVNLAQETNNIESVTDSVSSFIIAYIESHLNNNISIQKMAKDLNYSESYISNTFRRTMRCPIMQYIRSKKVIAAHSLISHGEKPEKAAELFGFNDYSTFYRSYLKIIGFPPSKTKKAS